MTHSLRVSNLPPGFDSSMLEDMFTMVGNVQNARIVVDESSGVSRGFVLMSTVQEAQDCILHFNGQSKNGSVLSVCEDAPHVPKVSSFDTVKRRPADRKAIRAAARKPHRSEK